MFFNVLDINDAEHSQCQVLKGWMDEMNTERDIAKPIFFEIKYISNSYKEDIN